MASTTGTATGAAAVLDALVTFFTSNGWIVFDTLVAHDDVVLKSVGTGKQVAMFARLTISGSVNNPFKNTPYHQAKCVPGIILRGYSTWSTGSHTGTGEYGMMGPVLLRNDATNPHGGVYRMDPMTSMYNGYDLQHLLLNSTGARMPFDLVIGGRYLVLTDANASGTAQKLTFCDLITGEYWLSSAMGAGTYLSYCLEAPVRPGWQPE
jgi:hypothetical protein